MYKKEYDQVFGIKDENWRKKYDYKNLKDFSYQVEKRKKKQKIKQKTKKIKQKKKKIKQIKNCHCG